MNTNKIESPITMGETKKQNAHRASLIFTAINAISLPTYVLLAWQTKEWQLWGLVGITLLLTVVGLAGIQSSRRGRPDLSMILLIAATIIGGISSSLLIAGLGILLASIIVLVSLVLAAQALPRNSLNRVLLVGGLGGLAAVALGQFGETYQTEIPALLRVVPVLAMAALIIFGWVVARQFGTYPISTKLLMIFLVVVLAAVASVTSTATWMLRNAQSLESAERTIFLVGLVVILAAGFLATLASQFLTTPIKNLSNISNQIAAGDLRTRASIETDDEIGELAATFNNMTSRLEETLENLEDRVRERTRALETSFNVSRKLSSITNPGQLAAAVVTQLQSAYDYYHVQIYLVEEETGNLILAGGTGEPGAIMLARKHNLPKGRGLVGRAAGQNTSVLIPDVSRDEGWLPNTLLPETKSEAAVPVAFGGKVLGVLDVQQNKVDGLTVADVELLQSVASQSAISLQNARSFEEARTRAELESLVNVIGQNIQRAATVEETLQTAARELGGALHAARVRINLGRTNGDN